MDKILSSYYIVTNKCCSVTRKWLHPQRTWNTVKSIQGFYWNKNSLHTCKFGHKCNKVLTINSPKTYLWILIAMVWIYYVYIDSYISSDTAEEFIVQDLSKIVKVFVHLPLYFHRTAQVWRDLKDPLVPTPWP